MSATGIRQPDVNAFGARRWVLEHPPRNRFAGAGPLLIRSRGKEDQWYEWVM